MYTTKEKISNLASTVKGKTDVYKAKAEEKAEKAAGGDKEIAKQNRKAKETEAKMGVHMAKAEHGAEKLRDKQTHQGLTEAHNHETPNIHHDVGEVGPTTGSTTDTTHPLGKHPDAGNHDNTHI